MDNKNPLNLKPKSGDYFTGEDVSPPVLPPAPAPKKAPDIKIVHPPAKPTAPIPLRNERETVWQKQIARIASGNAPPLSAPPIPRPNPSRYAAPPPPTNRKTPDAAKPEGSQNGDGGAGRHLPAYLRYLLSPTLKRATGNPAWVWTVKVTTEKNGKAVQKYQEFHLIVCWYQFLIGALGGIAVGLETEFFRAARLAEPNIPLPQNLSLLRSIANFFVQSSSSVYRLSKRALLSGYLFDIIDKNVEEYREKEDWKNMGISGGVTGAIFGLRGGMRGTVAGSILFAGFGSLAGYQYYRIKSGKTKPGK